MQVVQDVLDAGIVNLKQCAQEAGSLVPRAMRYSLTIRRVLKVKSLVKMPGQPQLTSYGASSCHVRTQD